MNEGTNPFLFASSPYGGRQKTKIAVALHLLVASLAGSHLIEMNYPKIGVQGYSLGNLQLTTDELVWTSADNSRQGRAEI